MVNESIQGFRLSPQQKHLWMLQESAKTLFWARGVIRVTGPLDESRLTAALNKAVAAHEILRTSYALLPTMRVPVQVISPEARVDLKKHRLPGPAGGQSNELISEAFAKPQSLLSHSLEAECQLLADLFAVSPNEHFLILSIPSLSADAESFPQLLTQIAEVYDDPTAELSVGMQYADFAEWQNEILETDDAVVGRSFWKFDESQLAVRLPFQKAARAFHPRYVSLSLPTDSGQRLAELAGDQRRLNSFLLSCWQVLVAKLLGRNEVTIGVAFDGRKYDELKDAVGLLSRFVPLSQSVSAFNSLEALREQVASGLDEAQQWQEYCAFPEPTSDSAAEHFFPVCFELRNGVAHQEAGETKFSLFRRAVQIDRYVVNFVVERSSHGLGLELQYDSEALDDGNAKAFAVQLETLLAQGFADPMLDLDSVEYLTDVDRRHILIDFNRNEEFPVTAPVHQLFAEQVKRVPDRVAVVFEDTSLTYAALNERANQLANHLRRRGVGPESIVGLCLERSLDVIVGLLGILKAGGAYLPLDPGLPASRSKIMMREAGSQVLVTKESLANDFRELEIVCLNRDAAALAKESIENPTYTGESANLAYVIFTSGSTGSPKGVAIEHRQLASYLAAVNARIGFPALGSFATVSTLSADLGNTMLFPALVSGGTLHLIAEELASNPDAFAEYFREHAVDCLKIVPSHLRALLAATNAAAVLPRRQLVLGGEASSPELILQLQELAPACEIFNHYGPTETTVGAVATRLSAGEIQSGSTVPLGRPLPNSVTYILDKHMQPQPIGVAGELYIGGEGVARGYIRQPSLTAERFVPDPFGREGMRLYRTGDLARYRFDGTIEFLGRADNQLKVRGYRIEPAEIEAAISAHLRVRECVVTAREEQPGDRKLVAYVVPKTKDAVNAAEMRAFLSGKLPEYMIPSSWVFLDRLPLNANGKVERSALPAPAAQSETGYVAPRNQLEETLVNIWSSVLGVARIGVHDNFFELGGDSILSIQIIARANQSGLQLSPRQLFQHQTIAELAKVAGVNQRPEAEQGIISGAVPLIPVQSRFFSLENPEPHHYNQSMLLELSEAPDPPLLNKALARLLLHHDMLRARFIQAAGGWSQVVLSQTTDLLLEEIDLSQVAADRIRSEIQEHAAKVHAGLDLSEGPIIRAVLYTTPDNTYLLIVIHHLVIDGVSWRILLEDLETSYEQLREAQPVQLPPKTTSFKAWGERLKEYTESAALKQEREYWLARLSQGINKIPVDNPRGENLAGNAETVSLSLDPKETRALLQDVPTAYRTQINEVLLTALALTLRDWTNAQLLQIDLEGHGREEIFPGVDLSRTVGWFTTIFPVVLDLAGADNSIAALRLVKEQLRQVPERGIGYGLLRYGSDFSHLHALPGSEVRFNYLGQLDRVIQATSRFRVSEINTGPAQSPRAHRTYLLNIIAAVRRGQLKLDWTFSSEIHRRETIEKVAARYASALRQLISQSTSADVESYSPSDFPKAKVSQEDLNKILSKLRL